LDLIFKIQPTSDHRAKFRCDWPTKLGDLALREKTSAVEHKFAPKNIVSGQTNNNIYNIILCHLTKATCTCYYSNKKNLCADS